MDSDNLINMQKLEQLKKTMSIVPGGFNNILAVYLEEAPQLMEKLRIAIVEGNAKDIRLHAHSLKSQCATLGAEELAGIFRDIEAEAKLEQCSGYDNRYSAAERLFQQVTAFIQSYKENNG